jgi:hypothetical protein
MALPITGKDTSVELMVNGIAQAIITAVVTFTEEEVADMIESEPLGTDDVEIKKLPKGWRGELEVNQKTGQLDNFIDAYDLAVRNNVPTLINIVRTYRYEDGTSKRHTYPDVTIAGINTSAQRGQNVRKRLPWRTGKARI